MKRQGTGKVVLDLQIIAAIADNLMHTKVPAQRSADVCVQRREQK